MPASCDPKLDCLFGVGQSDPKLDLRFGDARAMDELDDCRAYRCGVSGRSDIPITSFFPCFGGEAGGFVPALAPTPVDPVRSVSAEAAKSRSTALLAFRSEFGEITSETDLASAEASRLDAGAAPAWLSSWGYTSSEEVKLGIADMSGICAIFFSLRAGEAPLRKACRRKWERNMLREHSAAEQGQRIMSQLKNPNKVNTYQIQRCILNDTRISWTCLGLPSSLRRSVGGSKVRSDGKLSCRANATGRWLCCGLPHRSCVCARSHGRGRVVRDHGHTICWGGLWVTITGPHFGKVVHPPGLRIGGIRVH